MRHGANGLIAAILLAVCGCAPPVGPTRSPAPDSTAPQPPAAAPSPPRAAAGLPQPKAVALALEHDFGHMALGDRGEHTFLIRNDGQAPLTLRDGSTSCYCTELEVLDKSVPPGGTGRVSVIFEPKGEGDLFLNTAAVRTNDPLQHEIVFTIRGIKRALLAAEPPYVEFAEVPRGQSRTIDVLLHSQVLPDFELGPISATPPGIEVSLAEPTIAEATADQRTWAKTLRVTLPATLPKGELAGKIELEATGKRNGESFVQKLSIPITAKVRHGLTISGPKWQVNGLELGPLPRGKAHRTPVIIKAVGEDSPEVEELSVSPDWLKTKIEPVLSEGMPVGLLRLTIEIPHDAPPGDHTGPRAGSLRLRLKGLPVLEAKIDFAMVDF